MADELLTRLRRFNTEFPPQYQAQFESLVEQG